MKCSFCGNGIEQGTGLKHVKNSGEVLFFCSSKCKKNLLNLHRKPWKVKWTEKHRKKGK